jgi:hypothetical protein
MGILGHSAGEYQVSVVLTSARNMETIASGAKESVKFARMQE